MQYVAGHAQKSGERAGATAGSLVIAGSLLLLAGWYALATLPYLSNFPPMEWAQTMIAAPAYKLATQGVYGSDMFTGFYHAEERNYDHMPLYPLLLALAFKLFGLGVWPARLVSVLAGLAVILLTFHLGRQLYDGAVGLVAAALLCVLRLGLEPYESGIPLLDIARVIRFDVLVPVWVLASCSCFYRAHQRNAWIGYCGAGVLAGLATLTHLYGAFILVVLIGVVLWDSGGRALFRPAISMIVLGWALALLPYAIYVWQDSAAYRGQMLRHAARFHFLEPAFYLHNLVNEHWRYVRWFGGDARHPVLWPRVGIWVALIGVLGAQIILLRRVSRWRRSSDRLLLISLPLLAGLLALLMSLKRYPYMALVLPFLALQVAFTIVILWRRNNRYTRAVRVALSVVLLLAVWEGGAGVAQNLRVARATTPYDQLTATLARVLPPGARVLISQPYWFGLAHYDVRSINLAFVLSDPRYRLPPLSMQQAIESIEPDYIVVEDYFLTEYDRDPTHLPQVVAQWHMFGVYVQQYCTGIARVNDDDYGAITVYQCMRRGT